jgi:type IV pilus assembly protein PilE
MPTQQKSDFALSGFTLIELMIVLAVIAILAAIALPSYGQYVKKGRAKSATADLVALSLNLENIYQRTLSYPVSSVSTTTEVQTLASGWYPSQAEFFTYSVESTATTYEIKATGTGGMADCTLSLTNNNARTVTGDNCGGMNSW